MQLDERVRRQDELGRLEAAVGRVAERELPLLRDHLHSSASVPGRDGDRVRALAAAGAVLEQLVGAEAGEEEHGRRS